MSAVLLSGSVHWHPYCVESVPNVIKLGRAELELLSTPPQHNPPGGFLDVEFSACRCGCRTEADPVRETFPPGRSLSVLENSKTSGPPDSRTFLWRGSLPPDLPAAMVAVEVAVSLLRLSSF